MADNKFLIGMREGQFAPIVPIPWPLTADDALNLAAWLVAMAEPFATVDFADLLTEVQNS